MSLSLSQARSPLIRDQGAAKKKSADPKADALLRIPWRENSPDVLPNLHFGHEIRAGQLGHRLVAELQGRSPAPA